ncbi:MAG TPA: hypothetical protein VF881_01230 [Polyangiaceae bacterium]
MNDTRAGAKWTGRVALCCATLGWALGCGGAAPQPAAAAPAPAAPKAVAPPDLSEAPEPNQLVGIVRWRSPNATLETLHQWTGVRIAASDLAAEVFDRSIASVVSEEAPVDAVIALDSKGPERDFIPFVAVSIGVRSIESAYRAVQGVATLTEMRPGEYRVNFRHGRRKSDRWSCALVAAVGAAPGRFVCGRRDRDVDALRAYMARTLPKRDLGASDLHLELHAPPVLQVYGPAINQSLRLGAVYAPRKLEIGEPAFDRAIDRIAAGISDELGAVIGDLDTLTFDLALAPDKASASAAFRLRGQQSWTAATLANQATRQAPPPPMFWRLPAGASTASYQHGPDPRRFDAIRRTLAELVDGWLLHEGIAPADRAPINALFSDKYSTEAPWVSAAGAYTTSTAIKPAAKANAPPAQDDAWLTALEGAGWYVVGVGAPNQYPDFLKSLASAVSRPKIQGFIKTKLAALRTSDESPATSKTLPIGFTFKSVAAPKELPKGSLDFELTVSRESVGAPAGDGKKSAQKPPKATSAKAAVPPVKVHVLVVAEAAQTWCALGTDRGQLVKTVQAVLEGAPESGTLASRQDLTPLKDGKFAGASFVTLESFLHSWLGLIARSSLDPEVARTMRDARPALESAPNKGKTPMLVTMDVAAKDGVTWTTHVDVPKAVIEDAIILAASSGMGKVSRP